MSSLKLSQVFTSLIILAFVNCSAETNTVVDEKSNEQALLFECTDAEITGYYSVDAGDVRISVDGLEAGVRVAFEIVRYSKIEPGSDSLSHTSHIFTSQPSPNGKISSVLIDVDENNAQLSKNHKVSIRRQDEQESTIFEGCSIDLNKLTKLGEEFS